MQGFVDRHALGDVVNIADPDGEIWRRYGVAGQPTWVFITADGQASIHFGGLGAAGIQQAFADGGFA